MSDRKPLVLADERTGTRGQPVIQRLQPGDDLDIPLDDRVGVLEIIVRDLTRQLLMHGIEMPPSAIDFLGSL